MLPPAMTGAGVGTPIAVVAVGHAGPAITIDVLSVDAVAVRDHKVERHLVESGLGWTMLRAGFFAQNLADAYRQDIVEGGRIVLPAGRGRASSR